MPWARASAQGVGGRVGGTGAISGRDMITLTQLAACVLLPKVEAVNFCLSFPPIGPNSA